MADIERIPTKNSEVTNTPETVELSEFTTIAINAAIASAKVVERVSRGKREDLGIEWKEDATSRTVADIEGDLAIIKLIRTQRPNDTIVTEESKDHPESLKALKNPASGQESGYRWYADSLDGTRPFTEGKNVSTVGVAVYDKDGNYVAAAIAHPYKKEVIFAERGKGTYRQKLSEDFKALPGSQAERVTVSSKTTLDAATIALDSLYTPKNAGPKQKFQERLTAEGMKDGKLSMSFDLLGSNITYEADVARGATDLGLTDAKGGDWDWNVGFAIISEAGGVMIDPLTNEAPTADSEVMLYGNKTLVARLQPIAAECYAGYHGFR